MKVFVVLQDERMIGVYADLGRVVEDFHMYTIEDDEDTQVYHFPHDADYTITQVDVSTDLHA